MGKHYDVGVYGLWYGNNYGSMITYYALSKVLDSMDKSYAMIRNPLGKNINISELRRSHPRRFAADHYKVTPLYHLNEMSVLNEMFDSFLLGSDQMWNYELSKPYKQSYFFDFVNDQKIKVAYGASFGQDTYNGSDGEKSVTEQNLQRFDAISVRDDFSKRICEEDFHVPATIVLDPVFLCPREKFDELIRESHFLIDGEYIFAYILDPNAKVGTSIEKIAEFSGKKVIVVFDEISDKEKCWDTLGINDKNVDYLAEPTVQEWLCLFQNAKFVITDSFHGSCFSIIYRKPFIVLKNSKRGGSRFDHLLGGLGLQRQMVETPEAIADRFYTMGLEYEIGYDEIYDVIEKQRNFSLEWLKTAIDAPKTDLKQTKINDKKGLVPYIGNDSYLNKAKEAYHVCSQNKCTGCSACANVCPQKVIVMKPDNEGFLYPEINEKDKCSECNLCKKTCPVLNPTQKIKENKEPLVVYAAYSLDNETRYMSTSGGAFSEFAKYVLGNNGICYGAAYDDNFTVKHIRISDISELDKIRQSKYYQSVIDTNLYSQVKIDLLERKLVLFCGTPCQTAGLSGYLKKDYDNLIIVDFICHSVSSEKAFKSYLSELEGKYGTKATKIWFKNKENGWHHFSQRIDFGDKTYINPWVKDDYMKGFLKYKLFQRPSCHNCQFKGFKRSADATLGDFWGLKWNDPSITDNQENGVSVIMLHTEKVKKIFDENIKQKMFFEEHNLNEIPGKNGGLYSSNKVGMYRDYFFENLGKAKFSDIIRSLDFIGEKSQGSQVTQDYQNNIIGKLTKIGNVVINMHPTAKIIINGELVCNAKLPSGSAKECILILHKDSTLVVNGKFYIAYDSIVQIFPGGKLTLYNGSVNAGTTFAIKRDTVLGDGFLGGRHLVVQDSDFHRVIDLTSGKTINVSKEGIKIADHVWCGEGVTILKDVKIGKDVVIGSKSVVTRDIENNTAVAGIPATVVKRNITWKY